jgi:hypothetical protein
MTDSTPSAPEPFVSASEAREQIAEALRSLRPVRDVSVTITAETEADYCLHASFTAPSLLLFGFIPCRRQAFGFHFTGNKSCRIANGIVVTTNLCPPADGPPHYCIWTALHCSYLWNGTSFKQAIERIGKLA